MFAIGTSGHLEAAEECPLLRVQRSLLYPVRRVFLGDVGFHCLCARYIRVAACGVALLQFGDAADIEPIGVVGTFRQREGRVVIGQRLVELPELQIGESAIGEDLRNLRGEAPALSQSSTACCNCLPMTARDQQRWPHSCELLALSSMPFVKSAIARSWSPLRL